MHRDLVDIGLANSVQLNYLTLSHVGPVTLTIVPNSDSIKECLSAVKRILTKWGDADYYTDKDLETAKNHIRIQRIYNREFNNSCAEEAAFFWASSSLDYFTTYAIQL